jgi:hypothetical protein
MKTFLGIRMIRKAITYSLQGGQALHVWQPQDDYAAPSCFKRYKVWAHLFDQDTIRLTKIAKDLGVNTIVIEHEGKAGQHIDLCGTPLLNALDLAEKELDSASNVGYTEDRKGDGDYGNRQNDPLGVAELARSSKAD